MRKRFEGLRSDRTNPPDNPHIREQSKLLHISLHLMTHGRVAHGCFLAGRLLRRRIRGRNKEWP